MLVVCTPSRADHDDWRPAQAVADGGWNWTDLSGVHRGWFAFLLSSYLNYLFVKLACRVLIGRTMMLRLVAPVLAIAALSSCAYPRTAIVAGAVTAVAGGMLFAHESDYKPDHSGYYYPGA